ncbi:GntR family transcriptional regulator [Pseudonocardia sulfidoxydans NBRC 16205]|uniref:GntR family transcriptional regulator n=1 Tax=Pseudonocardia sulfidoxydans NBRC 16205 TaxID=1223511 RepID=A0A511DLF7_9PSEU|nr:FCD domain-containing protein [Pseudonocardia sulfidoxydans]GEL23908.1 GntR family transcriptional regulator [Pseudonocardia sulfidoxydans NBRC 16205]
MTVDAGLTTVRTDRACDAVIAQLEQRILDGTWPLNTRIPTEPELTAALGVGRNTVREAVRALEHAGLLEPRRGDGTYVRATSALGAAVYRRARQTDLLHVLDVRASLERAAAEAAARNRTPADAERVAQAARDRRAACELGDPDAFVAADLAFHRAVIAATGNPVLADLYDGLTEAVERSVAEIDRLHGDRADFPGHDELADAIVAGDPQAALAAADAYLDVARTIIERRP